MQLDHDQSLVLLAVLEARAIQVVQARRGRLPALSAPQSACPGCLAVAPGPWATVTAPSGVSPQAMGHRYPSVPTTVAPACAPIWSRSPRAMVGPSYRAASRISAGLLKLGSRIQVGQPSAFLKR